MESINILKILNKSLIEFRRNTKNKFVASKYLMNIGQVLPSGDFHHVSVKGHTVELELIVTETLTFPSKSSRNKNDSNLINGKTTPI